MPTYRYRYLETSGGVVTRNVRDTTALTVGTDVRVVKSTISGGFAGIVAYAKETINGDDHPVTQLFDIRSGQTTFNLCTYLPMWAEVSRPFVADSPTATGGLYFVAIQNVMRDGDSVDPVANSVAVVGWSPSVAIDQVTSSTKPARAWPIAVVDKYTSPFITLDAVNPSPISFTHTKDGALNPAQFGGGLHQRPHVNSDDVIVMGLSDVTESSGEPSFRYSLVTLTPGDQKMSFADNVVAGSMIDGYDLSEEAELGFLCAPSLSISTAGLGVIDAGTYNYIAYYEYADKRGVLHRSRMSRPCSIVSGASATNTVKISLPNVTKRSGAIFIVLCRTLNGGTQYHRVARFAANSAGSTTVQNYGWTSYADVENDSVISANPLIYRQPGTVGTSLDRYHGLCANHLIKHKDRVFYARETTVFFSSFAVDGEAPWFNPAFSFNVPDGTGPITALASMDGALVIFKKDSVFIVEGDGPPENGGSGTEFSPPRRLQTRFGCINHRSLQTIDAGLVYLSSRGLELIDRNYRSQWLGERVQRILEEYPYFVCSAFDRTGQRVLWQFSTSQYVPANGVRVGPAIVVCYDASVNVFTTHTYKQRISEGSYAAGYGPNDICWSEAFGGGIFHSGFYSTGDSTGWVGIEDWTRGYDEDVTGNAYTVPISVTTGWVKSSPLLGSTGSKQDRIRVSDLQILGYRHSNFNLKVEYASNFNRSSWSTIKTFNGTETNLTPVNLEFQPQREAVQSIKFRISTETPTGSTALGTGRQLDITGITVKMGIRGGGSKLPAAQKG